ncbi:glycine--tRNA ligase [Candidatus Bathyarchaeota archaeon]|jgi:glycyl-tRNA synthetase|nr:glycine--tRNA ligase [Candidatus Bathyarchaeota archaeon]
MAPKTKYDIIAEIAKRRGFFWPSFEIYGGMSGFTTYGDLGTKLKRNVEALWKEYFVRKQGFLELEAPVINPKRVFEASGHLENFKEYSAECSQCGNSFRADHLIEDKTGLENVEAMGGEVIKGMMVEHKIKCPRCGGALKEPTLILTMFKTEIGATGGEVGYLRPETAQAMFLNYKRGFVHNREKLPFAIVQSSKVARNEISPRRGMLRLREFTIMELELFFDPENPGCPWYNDVKDTVVKVYTEKMVEDAIDAPMVISVEDAVKQGIVLTEWQGYFMGLSQKFMTAIGIPDDRQRFRAHLPDERAHYSAQTFDHEVKLETWGWTEVSGCAYRTNFDLKNHMEASGQNMEARREDGTKFIPHVVEPSYGLDRLMYITMENSYERRDGKRNIMHIPKELAPYQVAVFPIVKKDGIAEKAKEVSDILISKGFWVSYDQGGSIGRRYARVDEIGTPLAVAIDYETMESGTITIRDRDSWEQVKLKVDGLPEALDAYFKGEKAFLELGEKVVRD